MEGPCRPQFEEPGDALRQDVRRVLEQAKVLHLCLVFCFVKSEK